MWAGSPILQPSVGCSCYPLAICALADYLKGLKVNFIRDNTFGRTVNSCSLHTFDWMENNFSYHHGGYYTTL